MLWDYLGKIGNIIDGIAAAKLIYDGSQLIWKKWRNRQSGRRPLLKKSSVFNITLQLFTYI
jgi:hypothetical protein